MRSVCARLAAAAAAMAVVVAAASAPLVAARRGAVGRGAPTNAAPLATAVPTKAAAATAVPTKTAAVSNTRAPTNAAPSPSGVPSSAPLGVRPVSAPPPVGESPRVVTKPPTTSNKDPAECLKTYLAAPVYSIGSLPAYLCCVDPSMGFCEPSVEFRPDRQVCSIDTSERRGGQCCFTQPPDGTRAGDDGSPLLVTCKSLRINMPCAGCTEPGAPGCADRDQGCSSRAPDRYRRCNVGVCVVRPKGRRGRVVVRPTWCGWFGTVAQCCLMKKMWWQRAKCCRECRVPGWGRKSWGCCWAGPRPW